MLITLTSQLVCDELQRLRRASRRLRHASRRLRHASRRLRRTRLPWLGAAAKLTTKRPQYNRMPKGVASRQHCVRSESANPSVNTVANTGIAVDGQRNQSRWTRQLGCPVRLTAETYVFCFFFFLTPLRMQTVPHLSITK